MTTINPEFFVAQFREEVNDHIQQMTQRLFQLEEQTGDSEQLLEDIFRIVHTLKGSARMMGYTDISAIAHKMEDLLVEIREGHLELDVNAADLLFFCLDTINYLMEGLVKHVKRTANLDDIAALFRDVIAGQPVNVPHLQAQMLTPAATDEPPPGQAPPPSEPLEESEERHYVRIHTGDLDAILNLVGEVLINYYRYEGGRTAYQDMLQDLREHREQIARLQALLCDEPTLSAGTPLRELGETLERSAEQMFHTTKALMKKARTDLQHTHLTMNKLQEQVIDIRMVPASRIFHLLPRFVRMTARRLGKMVELQLIGEETKIDSRIIEEMRDPLIQLIQNALHHGLETPEQRQQRGKPPTGLVIIAANQEANRIAIRIKDDGQGIQVERLREQALKAGLLSHRDLKKISDQELFEVLFHPGFSTSETVDDIAGRGFGLNVVRNHVDRVQGEIEVHSTPGVGTEFVLKLPLTLTILNALFVRVGNEVVAIPTLAIEKTFDLTPDRLERMGALPVVVIEQTLLPVVELGRLLQHGASQGGPPLAFLKPLTSKTVIVIQSEDRRLALIVDDLVEEREIVIKPLGPCLKRVRNVAGATTVRGEVVILLNVRDLVRSAELLLQGSAIPPSVALKPSPPAGRRPITKPIPRILLVDDSRNTREVMRNMLTHAGYYVVTAENGRQGLEQLKLAPFDAVVTDVEMPEMNGFDLTRAIKQEARWRHLPVTIVSTKGSPADQQDGLASGAQAYLVKGEFDEQAFVATIAAGLTPEKS